MAAAARDVAKALVRPSTRYWPTPWASNATGRRSSMARMRARRKAARTSVDAPAMATAALRASRRGTTRAAAAASTASTTSISMRVKPAPALSGRKSDRNVVDLQDRAEDDQSDRADDQAQGHGADRRDQADQLGQGGLDVLAQDLACPQQ